MTTTHGVPALGLVEQDRASAARPVLLATLDAPLLSDASRVAVDAALESGQPLLVVNAVETALTRCALTFGYDYITRPDVEQSLNGPAALALALGIAVERIRLRSPRPVEALVAYTVERRAGLLVLGPDRAHMRARAYRKAVRRILAATPCLVWLEPD